MHVHRHRQRDGCTHSTTLKLRALRMFKRLSLHLEIHPSLAWLSLIFFEGESECLGGRLGGSRLPRTHTKLPYWRNAPLTCSFHKQLFRLVLKRTHLCSLSLSLSFVKDRVYSGVHKSFVCSLEMFSLCLEVRFMYSLQKLS